MRTRLPECPAVEGHEMLQEVLGRFKKAGLNKQASLKSFRDGLEAGSTTLHVLVGFRILGFRGLGFSLGCSTSPKTHVARNRPKPPAKLYDR